MLYSFVCIIDLTAVPGRGQFTDHFTKLRAGFDPQFPSQFVSGQKRRWWPCVVPLEGVTDHLRGQFEVPRNRAGPDRKGR